MKGILSFLLVSSLILKIYCTIDISLPELEYLANHLNSDECWKLIVLLHSNKDEEIEFSHKLQQPVITQINCLEDLLHWNSLPGEGFDETHQILAYKLRQIDRNDLSDWLSQTVFEELGKDINKTLLSNPFKEVPKSSNKTEDLDIIGPKEELGTDHDIWKPYDTILTVITLALLLIFIWVIFKILKVTFIPKKRKETIKKSKAYESIPLVFQNRDDETSESFTDYDDQQKQHYKK